MAADIGTRLAYLPIGADAVPIHMMSLGRMTKGRRLLVAAIAWLIVTVGAVLGIVTFMAALNDTNDKLVPQEYDILSSDFQIGTNEGWTLLAWAGALGLVKTVSSSIIKNGRSEANYVNSPIHNAMSPSDLQHAKYVDTEVTVPTLITLFEANLKSVEGDVESIYGSTAIGMGAAISVDPINPTGWSISSSCLVEAGATLEAWRSELNNGKWPKHIVMGLRRFYWGPTEDANMKTITPVPPVGDPDPFADGIRYIAALTVRTGRVDLPPKNPPNSTQYELASLYNSMWVMISVSSSGGVACQGPRGAHFSWASRALCGSQVCVAVRPCAGRAGLRRVRVVVRLRGAAASRQRPRAAQRFVPW